MSEQEKNNIVSNVRVVSDGTPNGTKVEVDGVHIGLIQRMTIVFDAKDHFGEAKVTLELVRVPVEIEGKVRLSVKQVELQRMAESSN